MSEREEFWFGLRLLGFAVLALAAITAFIWMVFIRDVDKLSSDCPPVDDRLNAYERELQERECEAAGHRPRDDD